MNAMDVLVSMMEKIHADIFIPKVINRYRYGPETFMGFIQIGEHFIVASYFSGFFPIPVQ